MLAYFGVHPRSPVPEELPTIPNFPDKIEIKVGDNDFILIFAAFYHNFTARVYKIARTIETTKLPGLFNPDAIVGSDKDAVGYGLSRLFQLPKVLRFAGGCC